MAPLRGNLTLEEARAFDAFPLYFAGERPGGLPLVAVLRRDDTAEYVSFVYGDCTAASQEEGCAPPAEIQVWRGCTRRVELYDDAGPTTQRPSERATLRGLPALRFEDGARIELFARGATIVVFASSRGRSLELVEELRPVRAARSSDGRLAPPADPAGGSAGC